MSAKSVATGLYVFVRLLASPKPHGNNDTCAWIPRTVLASGQTSVPEWALLHLKLLQNDQSCISGYWLLGKASLGNWARVLRLGYLQQRPLILKFTPWAAGIMYIGRHPEMQAVGSRAGAPKLRYPRRQPAILEFKLLAAWLRYLGRQATSLEFRLLAAGLRYLGRQATSLEFTLLASGLRYQSLNSQGGNQQSWNAGPIL